MQDIVIVDAVRTATGRFGGIFTDISAVKLADVSLRALIQRSGVCSEAIDEVIMGMVYQGGAGANPARQVAVTAGLPYAVPALTVNQLCASGLRAVGLAWESLQFERSDVVVAGGMENMTSVPHYYNARTAVKLGDK